MDFWIFLDFFGFFERVFGFLGFQVIFFELYLFINFIFLNILNLIFFFNYFN